ncbi:MAG: ChrR family anti-sigma-E factor [Oleiphilaceae bacterium]|nr:ChrR family anti-sigma-E factor [Oleiphilaceae bacterium]
MSQHHPDSCSLMEFSAGNLTEPHALCIRLHLDKCHQCRSRVDMMESLGAVMMEQQPQISVATSTFDSILARIDQGSQELEQERPRVKSGPLEKLLGTDLDGLPWKRQIGDVSILDISDRFPDQPERVVMQKLTAGGKAPAHTHRGEETTIVLQGAFSDNKGVFNQWDFVVLDQEDNHKPVALEGDDCITLSVLSAPVRLTGTFTRLLNPFIT